MAFNIAATYNIVEDACGNRYFEQTGIYYLPYSPYTEVTKAVCDPFNDHPGNEEGIALPSAVRNAGGAGSFASPDIIVQHARGIIGFLNVTAVPTIVTVNARIQYKDPASGVYITAVSGTPGSLDAISASTAATGLFLFQIGNINANAVSTGVSRTIRFLITHSAAGDFTYSVGYSLMY
jgi:hypothetical protein